MMRTDCTFRRPTKTLVTPVFECVAKVPGKAVILSGAKNLCDSSQILRSAQNDANAMKSCRIPFSMAP